MKKLNKEEATKRAYAYFGRGYNCAESIVLMANDVIDDDLVPDAPRVATAFGLGMGCMREACGALSGAVIVLSFLYGRDNRHGSEHVSQRAARLFRKMFIAEFSSSNCGDMVGRDKVVKKFDRCRSLTSTTAGLLIDFIEEFEHELKEKEEKKRKL